MPDPPAPAPLIHFGRELDYLEDLGAKLRNLKGFATLAHELLQNADDVAGVTHFTFNICGDALIVENNGQFSDCLKPEEQECHWRNEPSHGSHRCDFHRFRIVAGADKRHEANTTGAFGIGFISVYQITDRPELISSGRHWIIDETAAPDKRIAQCGGCSRCLPVDLPGTRFYLPWALDAHSSMRQGLRAEPVTRDTPVALLAELETALSTAMLFLKSIDTVHIKRNGNLIRHLERVKQGNTLVLSLGDGSPDVIWHLLRGGFAARADEIRTQHPTRIEPKRSSGILIAIPAGELQSGLLCATLPTQQRTGLPFHINADFYPSEDRKRIIFEQDYQSQWNKAALAAAADAFASSFYQLRDTLGHQRVWSLLSRIFQVAQEADAGRAEKMFKQFWTKLAPSLGTQPLVFNHLNQWCSPAEVYYLQQSEEKNALPVLQSIGINCVHEDLRPHQNLLISKEVGVRQLTIDVLIRQLQFAGLTRTFSKGEWPSWLQTPGAIRALWDEINLLLGRRSFGPHQHHLAVTVVNSLANLSLAVSRDGSLCPCNLVYRTSDKATETMFLDLGSTLLFASTETTTFDLFVSLCPRFGSSEAIGVIHNLGAEGFALAVKEGRITVPKLIAWFVDRRTEILDNKTLITGLADLPVFPSAGGYNPLTKLSLPGDFADPLQLAAILDVKALSSHHDFLRELGIQDLSFSVYVSRHLIPALRQDDLAADKLRAATLLLATNRSQIAEDPEIRSALAQLPLIECADGQFRRPAEVYFPSAIIVEVLGNHVPQALVPTEHATVTNELFSWLGIVESPRFENIVTHVQEIVQSPPSDSTATAIRTIFAHLAARLQTTSTGTDALSPLKSLAWLPARGNATQWFSPSELYATFQDYLFSSQAQFLDVDRSVQNTASALFSALGLKSTPPLALVVDHLLHCASSGNTVNQEVYNFLNNNADDSDILRLRGQPCLRLPDGHYVRPASVFWTAHPFGRFRHQLGPELRKFNDLFNAIGVRETPTHKDAFRVLAGLADEFGSKNRQLDDEARAVCLACWAMLESTLEHGQCTTSDLASLAEVKCIPNSTHVLAPPTWLFFEDRAGLASKFQGFLKSNAIPRLLGTAKAMTAAGVRTLAGTVNILLLECSYPTPNLELVARIEERSLQLARVLDAQLAHSNPADKLAKLKSIRFESVVTLRISYELDAFGSKLASTPEDCPALFRSDGNLLLFVSHDDSIPWAQIARELALALYPDEEPGRLAPGLRDVLAAESLAEAAAMLDALGFPNLESPPAESAPAGQAIRTIGDQSAQDFSVTNPQPAGAPDSPPPAQPSVSIQSPLNPPTSSPSPQKDNGGGRNGTGVHGGSTLTMTGTSPRHGNGEGGAGECPGRQQPRQPRRGKLRSYVVKDPTPSDEDPDPELQQRRQAINNAGIQRVLEFEKSLQCEPHEMPHTHPGYDIESRDPATGGILRYIEVKSLSDIWTDTGVGLTRTEFLKAQELGDLYWLYIVEHAETADFKIHCIQNPAGKVDQFFYDDGWQQAQEPDTRRMQPPEQT